MQTVPKLLLVLTSKSTALVWAPYGHLWRNLRRASTIEIFSHISLQKSFIIRGEEVYSLLRQLFKVSNIETQKLDFKYLSSLLLSNIIMSGEDKAETDPFSKGNQKQQC